MHNKIITIQALVSGKVQGVYFRQSTLELAQKLKLTGWVKNVANNKVELRASGNRDAVMQLTDWLWQGPPDAQVSNVEWSEIPYEKFAEFKIERN